MLDDLSLPHEYGTPTTGTSELRVWPGIPIAVDALDYEPLDARARRIQHADAVGGVDASGVPLSLCGQPPHMPDLS